MFTTEVLWQLWKLFIFSTGRYCNPSCLLVCWLVRFLTTDHGLHWLAGGRRRVAGVRAHNQHRSAIAGAWQRFAPYDRFFYLKQW